MTVPTLSYLICATPRSGSILLSDGLMQTTVAGNPREYFFEDDGAYWLDRYDVNDDNYLDKVIEVATTWNGVCGAKIFPRQFEILLSRIRRATGRIGLSSPQLLALRLPNTRYVWLTRQDKVAQAISHWKAITTDVWIDNPAYAPIHAKQPARFDAEEIDRIVRHLEQCDATWQRYFNEFSIDPLRIEYESFVDSYSETISRVLDFLGVPRKQAVAATPRLRRQADQESREWANRYHEWKAGGRSEVAPAAGSGTTAMRSPSSSVGRLARSDSRISMPVPPAEPAELVCYSINDFAPRLVPARPDRRWMDEFSDRHPYRCLPLAIANAHGWEILSPVPVEIEWNGGPEKKDLTVRGLKPLRGDRPLDHFCRSNFSRGIVTFHTDYIFQTNPEWDLIATGPFNDPKPDAAPLTGIIETDWLPYPFTMNWKIMRPGCVRFEEDEPFCFVFPIRKQALADCQPEIRRLSENPELFEQHEAFRTSREEFFARLEAGDKSARRSPWQRHYFLGRHPDGTSMPAHVKKLRLKDPVDRRGAEPRTEGIPRSTVEPIGPLRPDSRWEDDSALHEIMLGQNERNELGRARIDHDGVLTDWRGTYIIASENDAAGCDFVVRDSFLTEPQCSSLCQAFLSLEDRKFRSDRIDPYWNNRFLWFADLMNARPDSAEIISDAQWRAARHVQEFYRLKVPIYTDLLQIVQWTPGMFMRAHADNANPDGAAHEMAHRDFSGIIYLNDDYEGGELYFTALDIAIRPRRGMFVGFTAGFHHEHAVLRILSGNQRLTVPFFFTFDRTKAEPTLNRLTLERSG
jgi:LPS sulfotransferase NodH